MAEGQQRAWLVRGSNVKGINVVSTWLEESFCSLPAERMTSVRAGIALGDLKNIVDQNYEYLSYSARRDLAAETRLFLNRMQPGDIVLTNNEDELHLGVVSGEPEVRDDTGGMSNLRRKMEWRTIGTPVNYVDLPDPLPARLSNQGSVVDLTADLDVLRVLLPGASTPEATRTQAESAWTPEEVHSPQRKVELRPATEKMGSDLLVGTDFLNEAIQLLRHRKQIIFYGPPGTGKTYLARHLAWHLTGRSNVKLIQFHPGYSYEDFFEGFRPASTSDGGGAGFDLMPGPLRQLVDSAEQSPEQPHVMIIDEINRANLPKVFGELYFLLEYRDETVTPLYSTTPFSLLKNVFFIGTMNTTDRSIASLDVAIRRRFAFLELHPSEPPIRDLLKEWLRRKELDPRFADLLDAVNSDIADRELRIGPSYLMRDEVYGPGGLERVWKTEILPLLEEQYVGTAIDIRAKFDLDAIRKRLGWNSTGGIG